MYNYICKKSCKWKLKTLKKILTNKHTFKNHKQLHYHITNETSFISILQADSFIFSFFRATNDNQEFIYLRDIVVDMLQSSRNSLTEHFMNAYIIELNNYLSNTRLYTGSFCQHPENDILWKRYGNNSTGYSLGFTNELFNYSTKLEIIPAGWPIVPVAVNYGHEAAQKALKLYIFTFSKYLEMVEGTAEDINVGNDFARTVVSLLPSYKDNIWRDETEHRFFMMDRGPNIRIPLNGLVPERPRIDNIISNYLKEIRIGKEAKLREHEIKKILPKTKNSIDFIYH